MTYVYDQFAKAVGASLAGEKNWLYTCWLCHLGNYLCDDFTVDRR